MRPVEAIKALAAGRDRTHDHAVSHLVILLETRSELLYHANGLVSQNQPWFHRVLASNNMDVSAADSGGGDLDHGFAGSRLRFLHFFNGDLVLSLEDDGFHFGHGSSLPAET